jgi:hypothetical protein
MYKATVNQTSLELTLDDVGLTINGTRFEWNLIKTTDQASTYFSITGATMLKWSVLTFNPNHSALRSMERKYVVDLKDKFDLLLEKMGMNNSSAIRSIA